MKKIFLVTIFILNLFALSSDSPLILGDLKNLENKFLKEYPFKKNGKKYINNFKHSNYFFKIKELLNNKNSYKKVKFGKHIVYKPNYDKVFDLFLKYKNNPATSYVATQLFLLVYGFYKKDKVIKYLKPFSEVLYKNKMCSGYLFYGDSLRILLDYKKARDVYLDGKKNCNIQWIRTYIVGRLLKFY